MPRPAIDLSRKIKDCLKHVQPLPPEAKAPLPHYERTSTDLWNSLEYVRRTFDLASDHLYLGVAQGHLDRLSGMILINLIETFERFLKEVASVCVDFLAPYVLDDRYGELKIPGSNLVSHFSAATLGKSLCESFTWTDCEEINKRFNRFLSHPFQQGGEGFNLFAKQPPASRQRYETLSLVWQLRHTMVHNVGVITQSDAAKLRLWAKEPVASPQVLLPTRDDIRYFKRFLDETAIDANRRIALRLAELLTNLHQGDPTLFVAQDKANEVSQTFGLALKVAGALGVLTPL